MRDLLRLFVLYERTYNDEVGPPLKIFDEAHDSGDDCYPLPMHGGGIAHVQPGHRSAQTLLATGAHKLADHQVFLTVQH